MEAFAPLTNISRQQIARAFYRSHADQFDYLTLFTDFSVGGNFDSTFVRNDTHGISTFHDRNNGAERHPSVLDVSAEYGSAGELENIIFMNNVGLLPPSPDALLNPAVEPYRATTNLFDLFDAFGAPASLDGQLPTQVRISGHLPEDDGEFTSVFPHMGAYSLGLFHPVTILTHEAMHRWGSNLLFVHPTKGIGFDSYDLLGRDLVHWSFFFDTSVPASQFGGAPRSSAQEGSAIVDLGTPSTYRGRAVTLDAGERVFETPAAQLVDGCSRLDQYAMGLLRAEDVGPFFYVDEPKSVVTGASLDAFNPANVLDPNVTMRMYFPRGGFGFKGKRVDLTIKNVQDYEAFREGKDNPKGRRFWGPKGNLRVRYFSANGRVDPSGDATVTLSEADRELGDEADRIDANGKPVDAKTMAFVLVVRGGTPSSYASQVAAVDAMRRAWQGYINGPATGGRGRFDTSLRPATH